jgi:chromosomal replication initiator protein
MNFKDLQNLTREIIFRAHLVIPTNDIEITWFKEGITKETFTKSVDVICSIENQENIDDVSKIIEPTVCRFYNITATQIRQRTRKGEIIEARQICMYFLNQRTKLSLRQIGTLFGFSGATVLWSCGSVSNQNETNKAFAANLKQIETLLNNGIHELAEQ